MYEVSVKGRETSEAFASYPRAERRAYELAKSTRREVKVYDTRNGIFGKPVLRVTADFYRREAAALYPFGIDRLP